MKVLLLSTYELGHQPLAVARPAAHLVAAGHDVRCLDLSVDRFDESAIRAAAFIGISVPMHTATRLGARMADRIRLVHPRCHICFYGLYASLHATTLLDRWADSVIGGEYETPLVELVTSLEQVSLQGMRPLPVGVITASHDGGTFLGRQTFLPPRRDLLPPLDRYATVDTGGEQRTVGYVEASRGCAHRCLHCPITPVYGGRLRIVPQDIVLADIRQLVRMGAQHITFGDPDFFNGIRHSLGIVRTMHEEFPDLTFDATIKVEHIREHRHSLPLLASSGCLFVVSAVEAVHDHILTHFQKGHTAADIVEVLGIARATGIPLRPTFVPFTPWTTLADYLDLLDFVVGHHLIRHVDPVQLAIRLLVPQGSSLIGTPQMAPFLGTFDDASFAFTWQHPDPRMDGLQEMVAAIVEESASHGDDGLATFARVRQRAYAVSGRVPSPLDVHAVESLPPVPRLTEPWFC